MSQTCIQYLNFSFDDGCRPVRLRKVVLGFPCSLEQSEFRFDLSLNYKLATVIETYSDQRPTLVVSISVETYPSLT